MKSLLAIICLIVSESLFGQGYNADVHQFLEYPTLRKVNKIFEDSRGIIWIGTDLGLLRESGQILKNIDSKFGFLPTTVTDIAEDSGSRLWICTKRGVFLYFGNKFEHILLEKEENDRTNIINHCVIRKNKEILLCTNAGLLKVLEFKSGRIRFIKLTNTSCYNAVEADNGLIYLSEATGIARFDSDNQKTKTNLITGFNQKQLSTTQFVKTKGYIYFASNDLYRINSDSVELLKDNIHPNYYGPLYSIDTAVVFGDFQMYKFVEKTKTISQFDMGSSNITSFYRTTDSFDLVGTFLSYARIRNTYWNYTCDNNRHESSPFPKYSTYNKQLYLIDRSFPYKIERINKSGVDNYFQDVENAWEKIDRNNFGEITDFVFLPDGSIIVCTYKAGLYFYNAEKKTFSDLLPSDTTHSEVVKYGSVCLLNDEEWVFGAEGSIRYFNRLRKKFSHIYELENLDILNIYKISNRELVLITPIGIYIWDNENRMIKFQVQKKLGISNASILNYSVNLKEKLIWWMNTEGHLYCISYKTIPDLKLLVEYFTPESSRMTKVTKYIRLADNLTLVADMTRAIVFDLRNGNIKHQIIDSVGILRELLSMCGQFCLLGSRYYTISPKNLFLYSFDLSYLSKTIFKENCKVELLGIQVNGQNYPSKADIYFKLPEIISFEATQNSLKFNIIPVVENLLHRPFLEYYLSGFEDSWVNSTQSEWIEYRRLPPGKYTLCCRVGGSFNSKVLYLPFEIRPYWYNTLWFYFAMGILFLFIGYFVSRMITSATVERTMRLQKMTELEKRVSESRLQSLRAQIDPHFISNFIQSIQGKIYKNKFAEADRLLHQYGNIIRGVFERSGQEWISIGDESKWLYEYCKFESGNSNELIEISTNMSDLFTVTNFEMPTMVIQPIVENAFKHGLDKSLNCNYIDIQFNIINSVSISINVRDSGANKITSLQSMNKRISGYNVTFERIELLNRIISQSAKIEFLDSEADMNTKFKGTWVRIILPIRQKYDKREI